MSCSQEAEITLAIWTGKFYYKELLIVTEDELRGINRPQRILDWQVQEWPLPVCRAEVEYLKINLEEGLSLSKPSPSRAEYRLCWRGSGCCSLDGREAHWGITGQGWHTGSRPAGMPEKHAGSLPAGVTVRLARKPPSGAPAKLTTVVPSYPQGICFNPQWMPETTEYYGTLFILCFFLHIHYDKV